MFWKKLMEWVYYQMIDHIVNSFTHMMWVFGEYKLHSALSSANATDT